uniref:Uncharacterized protein n=2 Tax=Rhodotorula toruloides TaxID=5286 RepID=A0A0K3CDW0_RHOTO
MPVLPTDILQMIFDELDAQISLKTPMDEAERRRMGLSLSLVCRAWRQAGTAFCWRVCTLMARDEDDVDCGHFDHLLDHPHLAALVRMLYVAWPRSDRPTSHMSAGEARLNELLSLVTGIELSMQGEPEDPAIDSAALFVLLKAAPRLEMINVNCTVDADPYGEDLNINFLPIKHAIINVRGSNVAVFDVTSLVLSALDSATTTYLRIDNVPFGRYFFELLEDLENLQCLELMWEYEDALAACLPHVKPILRNLPSLRTLKISVQIPDDGLDDTDEISHDILAAVPTQVEVAVLSLRVDNIEQGPLADFARARRDTALTSLVVATPLERILFEKQRVGNGWVWQEMDRRTPPTPTMAHLPADILQMIFDEVEKDLPFRLDRRRPVYGARRETGRSISLVCRAWRAGGTAIRWRFHDIDFTSRTADRDVQHLLSHRGAASSVRSLFLSWGAASLNTLDGPDRDVLELLRKLRNLETLRFHNAPRDLLQDLADDDARLLFLKLRDLAVNNTPARGFGGNLAATETASSIRCALRLKRLSITADALVDMDDDEPEPSQRLLEEVDLDIRGDGRAVTDLTDTALRCADRASLTSLTVKNVPFSASFCASIGGFRNLRQLVLIWPTDDAFACSAPHILVATRNLHQLQSVALLYPNLPSYVYPASNLSEIVFATIPPTVRAACITLASDYGSATRGALSSFFNDRPVDSPLEELVVFSSQSTRCFRKADQNGRRVWRDAGGLEANDPLSPPKRLTMPDLPLDVLNLIFRELDESLDPASHPADLERRRAVGRQVSLVCRAWRLVGTRLVWSHVEIADMRTRKAASLVEHLIAHPKAAGCIGQLRIVWPDSSTSRGLNYAEHRLPSLLRLVHSLLSLSLFNPPTLVIRSLSNSVPIRIPSLRYLNIGGLTSENDASTPSVEGADLRTLLSVSPTLAKFDLRCAVTKQTSPAASPTPVRPLESVDIRFTGNTRDVALATQTVLQSARASDIQQLVIANVPFTPLFYSTIATFHELVDFRLTWEFEDGLAFSLPHIATLIQRLPSLHLLGLMYKHEPAIQGDHDLSNRLLDLVPSTLKSAVLTLAYTSLDLAPMARYARAHLGTGPREFVALTAEGEITFFQKEDVSGALKWEEVNRAPLKDSFWRM